MIISKEEVGDAKELLETAFGVILEPSKFANEYYRGLTSNGRLMLIRELSKPVDGALEVFCSDKEINNNITAMFFAMSQNTNQGDN